MIFTILGMNRLIMWPANNKANKEPASTDLSTFGINPT